MDNQEKKEPISRDEILNKIRDLLGRDGVDSRIVLVGEAGIGKTWLAKEVSKRVTQETSSSYIVLWLHLNKKIRDEKTLYENISAQLSLFFEYEEGENQNEVDVSLETLKKNISNAIIKTKKKNLLLILDDEGSMTTKKHVMDVLYLPQYLQDVVKDITLKVLVTRRGEIQEQESYRTIKVDSLTEDESEKLLRDSQTLLESFTVEDWPVLLKSLYESREIKEPTLMSCIKSKSQGLPAAIVVLSKSLNSIKTLSAKQRKIFKELILSSKSLDAAAGSQSLYNPVLRLSYELLKPEGKIEKPVIDCFWHSLDFYKHCGCVYYRDLITQWILEGYFDPVRSVEKAYKDGHKILLELINRGVLKTQEDDMVVPEMAMSFLTDLRHHGLLGRSRLRFSRVYGGDKNKGLGKITQIDDMIKTVQGKRGDNSIRTILVSGNRLRLETPKKFFEEMKDLEVVGLFDPTMEYLIQSLRELKKLRVLVIRDYDLLSSIEELKGGLRRLQVLEVSGASSLVTISDDFFEEVNQLQSLNLSGLGIKSSPSSISQLKNLHSLILRDCSLLEDLPDVQHLKRLEILDVRGACNLITCYRNRTFSRLKQLQLLDLSESRLKRLPIFQDSAVATKLHSLTRLSLHNCRKLAKLPNLRPLSGLQVLDLSGTTSLVEIAEVCFEQKEELNILNLSCTKFTKLPSTISGLNSLSQLLIKDNYNLESLPNINGLKSLQVFDVSGCTNLRKIEGSFEEMCYLREVNLSGTRIETLPELPVKNSPICSKLLVLADSRSLIRDTWSQVKEAITRNEMSESLSSSGKVSNKDQLKEAWGFNCPAKKSERWENLYKYIYMNTIPFVDITSHQEVLEVQGSQGIDIKDKEALAKAEFVAFVDNTTASLSRVFNDLKAVKGCWVEMCEDIQKLFSGVDEERLRNLEILSITNLRLMDSICSSSSFKNLKKLNLDCCSSIKTLFPASEPPIFLEVLKIKFCDKLEKVFGKQVEVLSLHTLCLLELPVLSSIGATLPNLVTYKKEKCPNLNISEENLKSSVN